MNPLDETSNAPINPYASPQEVSPVAPALTHRQVVKKRLFQPGLVTVISGLLMTLLSVQPFHFYFVTYLQTAGRSPSSARHFGTVAIFLGMALLGSLICVYGGVQMLRVKHYWVCVIAAVVMTIPFTSPCNLIGLVIGIWTLVILLRNDTRAAFAEAN